MKVSELKLDKMLENMRTSPANMVSYCYPNGEVLDISGVASTVNTHRRALSAREENFAMLTAVIETLKGGKEVCASRDKLLGVANRELAETRKSIATHRKLLKEHKNVMWMVGSATSLLEQMFAHRQAYSSCLRLPTFATCRNAWYKLKSPTVIKEYATLAATSARLESPNNSIEINVLPERSVAAFTDNVKTFTAPEGKFVDYRIHGRAVVSFGVSEGGVPMLLSLDCTFNLDGVIDGLDGVEYTIIAFRPFEEIAVKEYPRIRRSDGVEIRPQTKPQRQTQQKEATDGV